MELGKLKYDLTRRYKVGDDCACLRVVYDIYDMNNIQINLPDPEAVLKTADKLFSSRKPVEKILPSNLIIMKGKNTKWHVGVVVDDEHMIHLNKDRPERAKFNRYKPLIVGVYDGSCTGT